MATRKKFGRRSIAAFWTILFAVLVGVLIYNEQITVLYVMVTLLLVALLVVVAIADLESIEIDGERSPRR